MLNDLYEFLFCPIHGILSPKNWTILTPVFSAGIYLVKKCIKGKSDV